MRQYWAAKSLIACVELFDWEKTRKRRNKIRALHAHSHSPTFCERNLGNGDVISHILLYNSLQTAQNLVSQLVSLTRIGTSTISNIDKSFGLSPKPKVTSSLKPLAYKSLRIPAAFPLSLSPVM